MDAVVVDPVLHRWDEAQELHSTMNTSGGASQKINARSALCSAVEGEMLTMQSPCTSLAQPCLLQTQSFMRHIAHRPMCSWYTIVKKMQLSKGSPAE